MTEFEMITNTYEVELVYRNHGSLQWERAFHDVSANNKSDASEKAKKWLKEEFTHRDMIDFSKFIETFVDLKGPALTVSTEGPISSGKTSNIAKVANQVPDITTSTTTLQENLSTSQTTTSNANSILGKKYYADFSKTLAFPIEPKLIPNNELGDAVKNGEHASTTYSYPGSTFACHQRNGDYVFVLTNGSRDQQAAILYSIYHTQFYPVYWFDDVLGHAFFIFGGSVRDRTKFFVTRLDKLTCTGKRVGFDVYLTYNLRVYPHRPYQSHGNETMTFQVLDKPHIGLFNPNIDIGADVHMFAGPDKLCELYVSQFRTSQYESEQRRLMLMQAILWDEQKRQSVMSRVDSERIPDLEPIPCDIPSLESVLPPEDTLRQEGSWFRLPPSDLDPERLRDLDRQRERRWDSRALKSAFSQPRPPYENIEYRQQTNATTTTTTATNTTVQTEIDKKTETTAMTLSDDAACVVCLTERRSQLMLPCKHVVSCDTCAPKMTQCPICRKKIQSLMKIFM